MFHLLPTAEFAVWDPRRAALNGLPADQSALHINIQGNLGALLLASNDPEAAIQELQAALSMSQAQQLPLHQFAGLLFNLGKALTTVGKLQEADEAYAQAAQAAYGHDLSSYAKAIAAPRSIGMEAAMQAVQVGTVPKLAGCWALNNAVRSCVQRTKRASSYSVLMPFDTCASRGALARDRMIRLVLRCT